jgi:hypothetical protein
MAYKILDIKKPCNQQWEEMQPHVEGKHCGICNHVIRDFSDMNDNELIQVLQNGKYSCGRFDKVQMGTMYYVEEQKKEKKKYWNSIAAAIVAGVLQISTGYTQAPVIPRVKVPYPQHNLRLDDGSTSSLPAESAQTQSTQLKIDFIVLNKSTKKAIPYAYIEIAGKYVMADSLGRVSFELEANTDLNTTLVINISHRGYEHGTKRMKVLNCTSVTPLYLRKKAKNKKREYIVGDWGF